MPKPMEMCGFYDNGSRIEYLCGYIREMPNDKAQQKMAHKQIESDVNSCFKWPAMKSMQYKLPSIFQLLSAWFLLDYDLINSFSHIQRMRATLETAFASIQPAWFVSRLVVIIKEMLTMGYDMNISTDDLARAHPCKMRTTNSKQTERRNRDVQRPVQPVEGDGIYGMNRHI